MAFNDLFQNLEEVCKSEITEREKDATYTQEETLFGDVTEPYLTHLKHGEALENIKSEAKTLLHTHEQLRDVKDKISPLSLDMDTITTQIIHLKQEAEELCSRKLELQKERNKKEKKLKDMESKLQSKDKQLENQKNDLVMFAKRIEEECGLKVDISNNQTYIISLGGLTKADDELCNCELTVDTSTIAKGEYKLLRTSPDLEEEIMRELERCLNETNDLAGFISSLRKSFKKKSV